MTAANTTTPLEHSLDFTKTFLQFPIGAASPFWMAYMGAASAGAAFWWISQMSRYTHLEAVLAKEIVVETAEAVAEVQAVAPLAKPVLAEPEVVAEAVELAASVEAAVPEPVIESPAPSVAAKAAAPRTGRAKAATAKSAPKPKTVN
jgi:hypothetical protein